MRLEKSKPKHRKGLWSPEEDEKLRDYVLRHGHGNWSSVPIEIGLQRNGKSCRLRWINYLRPGLKRGTFSTNEEELILSLHGDLGNKWSQIAHKLPGRTDNEIKNHWHTHLSKRSSSRTAATDQTVSQELNPWSISFPTFTTSPKPISSYTSQSSSTYTNGFPKDDGIRSSLPKLFFEEWLSLDCCQSNDNSFTPPIKFQLTNDFMGGYSSIDDELLLEESAGDGVITFPDWGLDHSPPVEFSNLGSSSDHGMCSGLLNQWYP